MLQIRIFNMQGQNIRFLNDASRRHYLIANAATAQVYQVFSDVSQGNFYTLEGYITVPLAFASASSKI